MNSRVLRTSPVDSSRLPSVRTRKWLPLLARFSWAAYVRCGLTDLKYCWNRISWSAFSAGLPVNPDFGRPPPGLGGPPREPAGPGRRGDGAGRETVAGRRAGD